MKQYDVIYADPPWRYDFSPTSSRTVERHYPTMTLEDICALRVPSADNAVLYLWATGPKLVEALDVMKAWGFTYRSQAVWDKELLGIGMWFRGQHELLLVGKKGKFSPPEASLRISSVIREPRTRHSKKPDKVRDYITSWYPDHRKLEMFAREHHAGWDVWGNEITNSLEIL